MKALGLALLAAVAMACSGATPTSPSAGLATTTAAQDVKPGTHVPGERDVRLIFQETELRHGNDHIVGLPVFLTGYIGGVSQGPVPLGFPVLTDRQSIASVDVPRDYTSIRVHTDWYWDSANNLGWCGEDREIALPYTDADNRIVLNSGPEGCVH